MESAKDREISVRHGGDLTPVKLLAGSAFTLAYVTGRIKEKITAFDSTFKLCYNDPSGTEKEDYTLNTDEDLKEAFEKFDDVSPPMKAKFVTMKKAASGSPSADAKRTIVDDEDKGAKKARAASFDLMAQVKAEQSVSKCSYCKWPSRGFDHRLCVEHENFIPRGKVVESAAKIALSALHAKRSGHNSASCCPLLHLYALPGYGKTTIGWAILRKLEAQLPGCVLPVYLDYSNGDNTSVTSPLVSMEQALCLGILGRLFYGKNIHDMLETGVAKQDLKLQTVLSGLASHWRASEETPVLLLLYLDEAQNLKENLKTVLAFLWAWTGRMQLEMAKAEVHHLYIVPLLTGTLASPDSEFRASGGWGLHSLVPLVDVLTLEQAELLVARPFLAARRPHQSESAWKMQCQEWLLALRVIIRSLVHLPRLLYGLGETLHTEITEHGDGLGCTPSPDLTANVISAWQDWASREMQFAERFKPVFGCESTFFALLYFAMRGELPSTGSDLLSRPLVHAVLAGDTKYQGPVTLSRLDESGVLFRIGNECKLPYLVISVLAGNLGLSTLAFKPFKEATTWMTFELVSPHLLRCLVKGYLTQKKQHVTVREMWRGAHVASSALGDVTLCLPERFEVLRDTEPCVTRRMTQFEWKKQRRLGHNGGEASLEELVTRESGFAFICAQNNPLIDVYSLWFMPDGRRLLVVEQAKHTNAETSFTSAQVRTWYTSCSKILPGKSGIDVLYIWFSNRKWQDRTTAAPAADELGCSRTSEEQLFSDCPRLLVFSQDTLPLHVSGVFDCLL